MSGRDSGYICNRCILDSYRWNPRLYFTPFTPFYSFTPSCTTPLLPHSPILRPAYLSSLKLLWLKPPNTPFRSLPMTQNTKNKMIISSIDFFLYDYQYKDTKKQPIRQTYRGLINNFLYSSAAVPFILFRLLLIARTAGLTAVEFYPILVEYAPDRAFATKPADRPDVVK